jgi:hypothetical protein
LLALNIIAGAVAVNKTSKAPIAQGYTDSKYEENIPTSA